MYRIKKTSFTRAIAGKIVNIFNQNQANTYSCDYINKNFPPAGTIMAFAGSSSYIPTGWIICDGSAVSRTYYSNLFSVIGTTYGAGDGSTTFNLPNLKGRVPVGIDSSQTEFNVRGKTSGSKTVTIAENNLPTSSVIRSNQWATGQSCSTDNTAYSGSGYVNGAIGDSGHAYGNSMNNLQPYIALHYIIKY